MKILLLEDEDDLAIAVQKALRSQQYIVDWVTDGESAWDLLRSEAEYQLAILDWMVPQLSGLALCQRLRDANQTLPVLILTARDGLRDRVTGLDAGADDYLVKPFGMEELLARVRALLRRPSQIQAPLLLVAGLSLDLQMGQVTGENQVSQSLTAKELNLLEYFMQHPNQILSQDQIRSRLWTIDEDTVSNVVAAQVRLLRKKLELCGQPHAIETLRGLGYRLNA